uniref:Uncharacterized protein n=1 Tax=Oryza punctata TaxID=4537 RepID=A0A0E0LCH7_ORYPU
MGWGLKSSAAMRPPSARNRKALESYANRPRARDIVEEIRASRRRRGVPEQLPNEGEEEQDNGSAGVTQTRTSRGANTIPPAPTTHAAKTVIIPSGDRNWKELPFNPKGRVPNTILGALLKHHYPQIVRDRSLKQPSDVPAKKWRHWCMKGPQDDTCAHKVRSDFMDKYRDGMEAAHGPNVMWVRAPLDAQVMYECTGRKAHGKFAMADGAIDSSEVQLSTNAHPSHTYTVRPSQIEVEIRQELANFKRQRQEDCQSIRNALSEFNNQIMEYMMNGSASTPPPQINLVALFPSHSSPTTQENSSRNLFNQTDGSNNGNCSQQDAGLNNNGQGGMGNNSENVVLQRMDGSTFANKLPLLLIKATVSEEEMATLFIS